MAEGGGSVADKMLGAILGGASSGGGAIMSSGAQNSFSRSVSTTASVGISLMIIRMVATAVQAANEDLAEGASSAVLLKNRGDVIFQFLRSVLHA